MEEDKLQCTQCDKIKTVENFFKSNQNKRGYFSYCKECLKTYRRRNNTALKYYYRIREEILRYYGGKTPKCDCCGIDDMRILVVDHIYGDGAEERKLLKKSVYNYIIEQGFPPRYRVLCHNCNHSYGKYGYCPHKGKSETSVES